MDASLHLASGRAHPGLQPWYLSQQQHVLFSMMAAAMPPHADQLQDTYSRTPCRKHSHSMSMAWLPCSDPDVCILRKDGNKRVTLFSRDSSWEKDRCTMQAAATGCCCVCIMRIGCTTNFCLFLHCLTTSPALCFPVAGLLTTSRALGAGGSTKRKALLRQRVTASGSAAGLSNSMWYSCCTCAGADHLMPRMTYPSCNIGMIIAGMHASFTKTDTCLVEAVQLTLCCSGIATKITQTIAILATLLKAY